MNTNKSSQPKKPLKDLLFDRIESEQVCPRSRLSFMCQECLVWLFWLLSVVFGALAVAVSLFVVTHSQYALYEATHENFLTFMVDALPYIWITVFILTAYLAVYNLRHTKRGYRYSLPVLMLGGVILSLVGGSSLQLFGFGYVIDDVLGRNMPIYQSQGKLAQKMWQMPREGRLVGMSVRPTLVATSSIVFEDISGQRWEMSTAELPERDIRLLTSGQKVRLLGKCLDKELKIFHACGVFPWMVEFGVTVEDMMRERRAFITSMQDYVRRHDKQQNEPVGILTATTSKQSICMEIMPIKRVRAR